MNIYRLQYQRGYASLGAQRRDSARREHANYVQVHHGNPAILTDWRGVDLYVVQPSWHIPDFFWWGCYVICHTETFGRIADMVTSSVVPLSVRIDDLPGEYVLLFVTNVLQATRDDDIKAWYAAHDRYVQMPYLFKRDQLERPQLFTNATFMKGQMLCTSDGGNEVTDFFTQYHKRTLTGIDFIHLGEEPRR